MKTRLVVTAALLMVLCLPRSAAAVNYYPVFNQHDFISLAMFYERSTRDVELEYRESDTRVVLPFLSDRQKLNQNHFGLHGELNFSPTLAGILEVGVIDLRGESYNFGDTAGRLEFKGRNATAWGVGLKGELLRLDNGLTLTGRMMVNGWNVNIQYGSLRDVRVGAWLMLEQKIYFNQLAAAARTPDLFYIKPYLGLGYSRDDFDGNLYTSKQLLLNASGTNSQNASLKLGSDFRMTNLLITVEGAILDQKSIRIQAGTSF